MFRNCVLAIIISVIAVIIITNTIIVVIAVEATSITAIIRAKIFVSRRKILFIHLRFNNGV